MVALFATSKGDNPNSFTNIKKIIQGKLKFEDLEIKNPLDNKKEANVKINEWCIKLK